MDTPTTILQYGHNKNCFLILVDSFQNSSRPKSRFFYRDDEIVVYEDALGREQKAYFSLQGKAIELCSGDKVQLNGWYASKLGLKNGDPLPLRRIKTQVLAAQEVHVEPLSTDDWEILGKNADRVEAVLLDQVRVVWKGQILPVWIQKSLCVYLKVGDIKPEAPCVVLENNTEVHIAPKVRASVPPSTLNLPSEKASRQAQTQQQLQSSVLSNRLHQFKSMDSPNKQRRDELTNSSEYENIDILEPKPLTSSPMKSPRSSVKRNPSAHSARLSSLVYRQSSLMGSVMKYLPSFFMAERREPADNLSNSDRGSFIDFAMKNLPTRNAVLRVQSMGLIHKLAEYFSFSKAELNQQIVSRSLFNFRSSVRQPSFKENLDDQKNYNIPLEVFQPSTVYIDAEFTKNERLTHPYLPHLPDNFIARLQKLPSPQEKAAAGQKAGKQVKTGKTGPGNESSKADIMEGIDGGSTGLGTGEVTTTTGSCYVRVVAIDRKAGLTDKVWQKAADHVLSNQPLLHGHVIIPDLLRRQLHLETTGLVWIQTGSIDFVIPHRIHIYLLSSLPKTINNDLIIMAFTTYIRNCADEEHPLVVFQGIFLRFVIFPDVIAEVQLTFFGENDLCNNKAVTMLSESNIDQVQIVVERGENWEDKMNVVNKMLPYCQTVDFDPIPIPQKLKHLGGVDSLVQQALLYLHASLASRPLSRYSFQVRGGLSHGILLITGPKGSGKSSLVKGLCRRMGHPPVLAYVTVLDCKTLRGKTVATIQKILELTFDEAAWREPAVVVLENLDVIVPATSGPETEITGEALYSTKNAQVLENIVRYEIENNSRVTVIATSTTRSSLHPSLISSRGLHCIQQTLNIGSPDKEAREKILGCILQRHSNVTSETVKTLDMTSIAMKTEGFVARDLELLVNRTLHFKMSTDKEGFSSKYTLTTEDFKETLSTFRPVSVRNVPLHKAGDLGWVDVGGLNSVKMVLMETLKWPTKYPQLFSSCPLRLRSGILLYGAPGTGKTLLAGVVAKECGLNFISVKGPEVLNKYIGASEQAIRDLFTKAQSAKPCILFFDEFDSIAPKRGHDSTGVTDRVVNQLLTQLDGVEGLQGVYVLAASSRPDLIDPALLRPGRLDICLNCAIPDEDDRYAILQALTQKMHLASDINLKEVAALCEHFTGADLKALLYNAQLKVIHQRAEGDQSISESIVVIKGDSNQCATRRASVVRNEAGTIKLSMSKSFSESSSGGRSPLLLDQHSPKPSGRSSEHQSPKVMINTSGNSSAGRSPYGPHEGDMDVADGVDFVVKDKSSSNKLGKLSENIFQYPDVDSDSGNKVKLDTSALLDGEKEFQGINKKHRRIASLTLEKSTSSPEFLPSAQAKRMSVPMSRDISEKYTVQENHKEHSAPSVVTSAWPRTEESHEAANSTEAPVDNVKPKAIAQGAHIIQDDVDAAVHLTDDKESAGSEINGLYSTPKGLYSSPNQPRRHSQPSYRKRRINEKTKMQGSQNNLIVSNMDKRPGIDVRSPSVEKPVTVFTSLERGLATLTVEDEARYLAMVKLIQHRDEVLFEAANARRRTSLQLESKSSVLLEVSHCHLVEAAKSMRPSVSASERDRYLRIYDNFVSSRKGGFEKAQEATVGKRATLA